MINRTTRSLADPYNAAYQAGAQQFETHIMALVLIFGVKVFIMFPPIQQRLANQSLNYYEGIRDGLDIVAFLVVMFLFWGLLGNPVVK